jgi:hypothetical protein
LRSIRRQRRLWLGGFAGLVLVVAAASLAWACVPQADYFGVSPASGPPGTDATVTGRGFPEGQFEIRWDSSQGALLATANGPEFSVPVKIPAASPGVHYVTVVGTGAHAAHGTGTAPFEVTGASPGQPATGYPAPSTGSLRLKRARAIARCKRRYRRRSASARRKRAVCIRRAKKRYRLTVAQAMASQLRATAPLSFSSQWEPKVESMRS